jgi:hypothetical protein
LYILNPYQYAKYLETVQKMEPVLKSKYSFGE